MMSDWPERQPNNQFMFLPAEARGGGMPRRLGKIGWVRGVMPFAHSFLRWVSGCLLLMTFVIVSLLILYVTYKSAWKVKELVDSWIVFN